MPFRGGKASNWYPGCHSGVVELRTGTLGVIQGGRADTGTLCVIQGRQSCVLVPWVSLSGRRAAY